MDLVGRYSNPDIVTRLQRVLAGQVRDRVSHRPVPSLRQKPTRLTDSQRSKVAEAERLYASGISLAGVGERLGFSARSVLNAFRSAGIVTRPVGTNQWR